MSYIAIYNETVVDVLNPVIDELTIKLWRDEDKYKYNVFDDPSY